MARKRGNGSGSLFQRKPGGPWIASWYGPTPCGKGRKRYERSTKTTSRSDAERIVRKWAERAQLESEGLVAPEGGTLLQRHAAASLTSHVESFAIAKRAEGRTDRHIDETVTMIEQAADACEWPTLGAVAAEDAERYLARRMAPPDDAKPWTPRTAHKHATALRTFTRWCVADGRLAADPLARLKKPSPHRQRERRILLVDEWAWLRSITDDASERFGMTGRDRRLLYELALQSGLRSTELRSLARSSLSLEGKRPYVALQARDAKSRRACKQYIRTDLADDLAQHIATAMPGAPVFTMPRREHVAEMLRHDLEAARAAWLDQAGSDAAESARRSGSDFLAAEDHDGRVLDFHALRHTCGAWAAMGGASPKAIQTLMRHSKITLTLDTYGPMLPDESAETVHRMPIVEPVRLSLTGTTDATSAPATNYATAGQQVARGGTDWRSHSSKNAPGTSPRASTKRGGRDSNPQPPDRQSGTLTN